MEDIDILMVKSAIVLILAGLLGKYPDEVENVPMILKEISDDYKSEIKKWSK